MASDSSEIDGAAISKKIQKMVEGVDVYNGGKSRLSVRERKRILRGWRSEIARYQYDIATDIAMETGKPVVEALQQEVTAALGMLRFLEKRYPRNLKPKSFRYPVPGYLNRRFELRFDPLGVVAIITPANFPFSLAVMQAGNAVMCGNGVVLKPSERCPNVSKWFHRLFSADGVPISVLDGGPEVAESLIRNPKINKVIFTGSRKNGLEVARLCGEVAKPCILEMGGGGAAIVLADADMESTARALAWSAGYSVGNSCIGTRQILLLPGARTSFLEAWARAIAEIGTGDKMEPDTDIESLIGLDSITFIDAPNEAEALRHIHTSENGLSASIWTADVEHGKKLARQIRTGMVWVNDVSVALPQFPWGGLGDSGWGRLYAAEAIPELTNMKIISSGKAAKTAFWRFPYSARKLKLTLRGNRILRRI